MNNNMMNGGNDMQPTKMNHHNNSIRCGVDTCHYYDNNYCNAVKIEVNPMGDGTAKTSDGTCCTTFVPRNNY